MQFVKMPIPSLTPVSKAKTAKALANPNSKGYEVTYPVSYRYNGLIEHKGEWYRGFEVPAPKVPKGWRLRSLGVGLNLNAKPPIATMFLERIPK